MISRAETNGIHSLWVDVMLQKVIFFLISLWMSQYVSSSQGSGLVNRVLAVSNIHGKSFPRGLTQHRLVLNDRGIKGGVDTSVSYGCFLSFLGTRRKIVNGVRASANVTTQEVVSRNIVRTTVRDRKTKIVSTIGPTSSDKDVFFDLAKTGMNVVRLNMSHGDHDSHMHVVNLVREYNANAIQRGSPTLAILLDTKGPEVRSGDVHTPILLEKGDAFIFTIKEGRDQQEKAPYRVSINYDGFIDDVAVGDRVLIDGGILSMDVISIDTEQGEVVCTVVDGGSMGSRRHINVRGKSANLPAITEKDWSDITWGIHKAQVDYFALSFVRDADVIHQLKKYLIEEEKQTNPTTRIQILAKIESADSTKNLEDILDAVDGAMVARGDLGAELPIEEVPFWQDSIVQGCRKRGKPCIVATNMLESMIQHPLPTRAEVTDISVAVRESTDAVMLSGETAYGNFPLKSVEVMGTVCQEAEEGILLDRESGLVPSTAQNLNLQSGDPLSEVIAFHAAQMSDTLKCPLIVFSRRGNLPKLLSNVRPNSSIFCFTDNEIVQRRLALYHGIQAFLLQFGKESEEAFAEASALLLEKGYVNAGEPVIVVRGGTEPIWKPRSPYAAQIRFVG